MKLSHAKHAALLLVSLAAAGCGSSGSGGDVSGTLPWLGESPAPGGGVDLVQPGPSGAIAITGKAQTSAPNATGGDDAGGGGNGNACQAVSALDSACTDAALPHAWGCPSGESPPNPNCQGPVAVQGADGYCCP